MDSFLANFSYVQIGVGAIVIFAIINQYTKGRGNQGNGNTPNAKKSRNINGGNNNNTNYNNNYNNNNNHNNRHY